MRNRLGGLPLAVYVVALLLIPLAAVAVLSVDEVRDNNRAVGASNRIAASIDVELAATRVSVPLEVERIALVGLARIDELGVDRSAVIALTGLDFESVLAENADQLEVALDGLDAAIAAERGNAATGFGATLAASRAAIADHRSTVDARSGNALLIDSTFQQTRLFLEARTAEARSAVSADQAGTVNAASLQRELQVVGDVVSTATSETAVLNDAIMFEDEVAMSNVMGSVFRHEDALSAARAEPELDPSDLRVRYSLLAPIPAALYDGTIVAGSVLANDLATLDALVAMMIERIDYLEDVHGFAVVEGAAIAERAGALASEAEQRNRITMTALVLVGLGSVVFSVIVIRSFARPLTQLRAEAEYISNGGLDARSLPLEGPSDIRKVTAAMNDMAGTLRSVDVHMKLLASGQSDERGLVELPGEVGASMRHSVERVTVLTSELQISQHLLERQARHDALTGLPNRLAMLEHLDRLITERGSNPDLGVMFVDIDGFKSVNDTHGHAVGDIVLTEIAHRLSNSIRDIDMVARLGGDEFLVVVEQCSGRTCLESFGQRIIREIEQPHAVGEQLFAVSASVGVTSIDPLDDAMAAIARADAAVYHAKRRGRRRVEMFDADLQTSIEHLAQLELVLRRAIQDGELRMFLQPLGDLTTGEVCGAEALVRWQRPGVGLVMPGEFIPVAERSGLIFELERWMLGEACRRIAGWRRAYPDCGLRLAVNISGRHLIEGDLLADLDAALSAAGADPTMLEIELTESQLLDDVERASTLLGEIRERGIRIAIDDFGTGYSSMTYLQKLPLDVVKIDQSFISRATTNGFDSTIVEAVVTIGRTLALDVVAEGVETPEQLAYVTEKGVTRAQGFLLARPMPADEADDVIFGGPILDVDAVRAATYSEQV